MSKNLICHFIERLRPLSTPIFIHLDNYALWKIGETFSSELIFFRKFFLLILGLHLILGYDICRATYYLTVCIFLWKFMIRVLHQSLKPTLIHRKFFCTLKELCATTFFFDKNYEISGGILITKQSLVPIFPNQVGG